MKDYFSAQSSQYKTFRPTYQEELFSFLFSHVNEKEYAWDCGTGNGQVAVELAKQFTKVYATDISRQQLSEAPARNNIEYSVQKAENVSFPDNGFDLVTVAQAIHWFNINKFYDEVQRTLKTDGLIAVIGYGLVQSFPESDKIISHFYQNIVGNFWDYERKYLDEKYQTLPFPFREIKTPEFCRAYKWSFDQLIGYLNTWSPVQNYKKQKGSNPVDLIFEDLKSCWGDEVRPVRFPVFLRLGRLDKKPLNML